MNGEELLVDRVADELVKQLAKMAGLGNGGAATLAEVEERGGEVYDLFYTAEDLREIARAVLKIACP